MMEWPTWYCFYCLKCGTGTGKGTGKVNGWDNFRGRGHRSVWSGVTDTLATNFTSQELAEDLFF